MKIDLKYAEKFEGRHNGPDAAQTAEMLKAVGASSLDDLIAQTVPKSIMRGDLKLPEAKSEFAFLRDFKKMSLKNKVFKSFIGAGYHDCTLPGVIKRNILENPGWYTAYTPYQAEIAQGRLEALINFQTMIVDLTGMEIANASLLDEGTAAGEAMTLLYNSRKKDKKKAEEFWVDKNCHPQTLDVLLTRSEPLGIEVKTVDFATADLLAGELFGILLQYPGSDGTVIDYTSLIASAAEKNVFVAVATDLLALTLLKSPGEMGADVVVGTSQRFGVPMGFGGPHAAFFATRDEFKRSMAGRIIGLSKDATGKNAYRMALQTREQHIKREKATSNICTAQVLLAVIAGAYAVYHGPKGLKAIAERTHGLAKLFAGCLDKMGFKVNTALFFDTFTITLKDEAEAEKLRGLAESNRINFRYFGGNIVGMSFDETSRLEDVSIMTEIFAELRQLQPSFNVEALAENIEVSFPANLARTSEYLTHPVFNTYHSEHEMLRYLKKLENKDLSLTHSMIALGSCTMKLNATSEMEPVTWPEFGGIHPFAPEDQTEGYLQMIKELESWLCEITGFDAVSLQPNSGAQGEFAGLMVIRAYHQSRGEGHRNIALIPSSAHGTNPASAVVAGMQVIVTKCDEKGNIDVEDLRMNAEKHAANLSCLMVTYPSTHGVFEESIKEICSIIRKNGGRIYMDGANMNAQVGLTSPANIGADVCHLNLHKTFCIPHGGGGPGMGPIGVVSDLAPFLPGNPMVKTGGDKAITAVSAAPYGSASILVISYAYIAMMGAKGLKHATQYAILNANYMKERLSKHYEILYTGANNRCAHEMIVDCRGFKKFGIEVVDIAKRLMDYGFHAPTVSFPVAGTLMIEPTESETKTELDKFCDALISIYHEIMEVAEGKFSAEESVLKNAPHTAERVMADEWTMKYSRQKAAFPLPYIKEAKFWPSVSRIDDAYGDRNLVCSCLPMEAYQEA